MSERVNADLDEHDTSSIQQYRVEGLQKKFEVGATGGAKQNKGLQIISVSPFSLRLGFVVVFGLAGQNRGKPFFAFSCIAPR